MLTSKRSSSSKSSSSREKKKSHKKHKKHHTIQKDKEEGRWQKNPEVAQEIKETKEPIGIITFLHRDNHEFPDIGFALLPKYEKKGYTFEASKEYLNEIIKSKICKKIIGITLPENENSIKLLRRLGLEFESKVKVDNTELSIYSMTIL